MQTIMGWSSDATLCSCVHFLGSLWNTYFDILSYIVHRNWTSDKMLGFMLSYVFVFITHKHCSSRPVCLALLAISFLNIKCFFFFYQENRSLLWIMLSCMYVFWRYQLELWQKALEENITIFGTGCWKTHIAVMLIHELGHLKRKPQNSTWLSRPSSGSNSASKLLFMMLVL